MKWIFRQTIVGVREANKYIQPWARQQLSSALIFWDEQKSFYRDVEKIEQSTAYSDDAASGSR